MPKQPKEDKTQPITASLGSNVDPSAFLIGVTVDGVSSYKEKYVGKEISINLKQITYFGVGNSGGSQIWLSPDNYWAEVPSTLTNQEYEIIHKSILAGNIILGKKYIPPIEKASNICEHYWTLLQDSRGLSHKPTRFAFTSLFRKGHDSGWTAKEIAHFCLEKEKKSRNRKDIITMLSQVVESYDGPISLYDPPDEAQGIRKVVVKSDGTMEAETNSGEKVAKPMVTVPPSTHKPGNKTADKAVDDLLN